MGTLGPLINGKSDLSVRNGFLLFKQHIRPMMGYAAPCGFPLHIAISGGYRLYNPRVFAFLLVPLVRT